MRPVEVVEERVRTRPGLVRRMRLVMFLGAVWLGVLLPAAVHAVAPASAECVSLRSAHAALLAGSFTSEREFTLVLNGELKARELSRVTYSDGTALRVTLEKEVLDDGIVLDEGDSETALAVPFACERAVVSEAGTVELENEEGTEVVVFSLDRDGGVLVPRSWVNRETTRFLWKKLAIEATATYRHFEWN